MGLQAPSLNAPPTTLDRSLALLEQGWRYAERLRTSPWHFAVDYVELAASGTTRNDLRWLHARGFVECGLEVTRPGEVVRCIRKVRGCVFAAKACYVMTPSGFASIGDRPSKTQALKVVRLEPGGPALEATGCDARTSSPALPSKNEASPDVPIWDAAAKLLVFGGRVVKEFRGPAMNQLAVLAEFQRQAWPVRIDDPLPDAGEQSPKRRLNDTIRSLNRNHQISALRFSGDGTGAGVLWRILAEPLSGDSRR